MSQSRHFERYVDPIFPFVHVECNIEFARVTDFQGNPTPLCLDVYSPEGDMEITRPVIIFLHGGGFKLGSNKNAPHLLAMANEMAKLGYVYISIDYRERSHPEEDWAGTIGDAVVDARSAVNWIRENHMQYGIDPGRIVICGSSAGAMIGVTLCYHSHWDKTGIIGLIDLWGSPWPRTYQTAIHSGDPPALIIHGTADPLVPYQNSVSLANTLKKHGIPFIFHTLEGEGHTPVQDIPRLIKWMKKFIIQYIEE